MSTTFLLNTRFDQSGLMLAYYYGSPSYIAQRYFTSAGKGNKSFRINPYMHKLFFRGKLDVTINGSYWYQVVDKTSRTSIFSYIIYNIGKGWSVNANILLYNFNRIDEDNTKRTFSDLNFNLGVKKVFDLPQPAVKYRDLKIVFFRDLNGNRIKDENEVGIDNILVNLENQKDSLNISSEDFYSVNLISDQFGEVNYSRLPAGLYNVSTQELNGANEYVNELGKVFQINLEDDMTTFVPFIKSNKIYGSIMIKRDPFSSLGYVSPGNIKVTATDTLGNAYPALSNADGDFIIYAPQAGLYTVSAKNIFGDGFILRQSEFMVDFNGLKEFALTFVFEERKRKINFSGDANGLNLANKNFNVNDDGTSKSGKDLENADPRFGNFDEPSTLPQPIDKSKVRFKVQVGAYNTNVANELVDQIRTIENIQESPTRFGLTRFTLGSFKSIEEAEKLQKELIDSGKIKDTQFIIVIGEYSGKFVTAGEAKQLLE